MPLSNYSAAVTVEIAFNAGFNTPAASRTWTDVSDYVELAEGISITGGRQDERSQADANHLTLVLDNRDGRFTPARTGSPYYPNVKLDRPIRVTATPVDGAASGRFLGFIDEWPVEWEGTDGYAKVTVSASSRLSRLGSVATMKSIVETVILADGPVAYYTMGEPEGSLQANDCSGRNTLPLKVINGFLGFPLTFGDATGPGVDSLTAVHMAGGGQYLQGSSFSGGASGATFETSFLMSTLPFATVVLAQVLADQALSGFSITVETSGALTMRDNAFLPIGSSTTASYVDGATHVLALTVSGNTYTLYVDGMSVASGIGPAIFSSFTYSITLDALRDGSLGGPDVVMAHVAAFDFPLTSTQVANHATAMLTGFAGETTSARLVRYAAYGGVESAALSTEPGQTTVQHVDMTGKQVVELMRLMEATEGGVLFDGRDGLTTFHNRAHRVLRSSSYTLDMAQHMVESGYAPKLDRSAFLNDITSADVSGQFTAHVFDTTSQTDNGFATLDIQTASQDNDEPLFLAGWMLYKYKTPLPRVANLTVDALAQVGKTPNCATVMATNVGDRITVSNQPTQADASTKTYFVEGWTETYGPESLVITFNVSPTSPDDQTLKIGDASRGVIGTNPIAL